MKPGNNIRKRKDGYFEARYIKGRDQNGKKIIGYCYGNTYEEAEAKRNIAIGKLIPIKENNLLILGAGDHGNEVRELAKSLRLFHNIDFLDDDQSKPGVIGAPEDAAEYIAEYPIAIAAVGDNALRTKWMISLIKAGFVIPTLIHPNATVSPSAVIQAGTVICAGATVGYGASIGRGCIIDSGAVIEKNSCVDDWTWVACGEIVYQDSK